MKAVIWTRYGSPDVLALREVPIPTPQDHDILVRIHATTVTAGDCEVRSLRLPFYFSVMMRAWIGIRKPTRITILGTELAGEVTAVGSGVTRFKVGDRVFGTSSLNFGTNAEYTCLSENAVITTIPANLTYGEAAAVPFGARDALFFLRKAHLQPGQKLLINGAGGTIGTFGVQLAKHFGAEVTAVDSGPKLDMLRSIGADHVIDYTQDDFTRNGVTYDVIFDVVGKAPFGRSLRALTPNGYFLIANPRLHHMLRAVWALVTTRQHIVISAANETLEDLEYLRGLAEAGTIRPVIDRTYPLEQIADAHRYVETGQKAGNVVIAVA